MTPMIDCKCVGMCGGSSQALGIKFSGSRYRAQGIGFGV